MGIFSFKVASALSAFIALLLSLYLSLNGHVQLGGFDFTEDSLTTQGHQNEERDGYYKSDVFISVNNSRSRNFHLHAWLIIPSDSSKRSKGFPLIILSHGLGSQKDHGLESFGAKFASAGYASLIIDYRHFGNSRDITTSIRNYIHPWNHVDDIKSAITHVVEGSLDPKIDSKTIILWGTSFAGGHVLVVGNEMQDKVKAIISQIPNLDGKAASKRGIVTRGFFGTLQLGVAAIIDTLLDVFGLPPLYIKIVGVKGDLCYMTLTEPEMKTYYEKHPTKYLGGWKNLAPARSSLFMSLYNPIDIVPTIKLPILFIAATSDTLCPIEYVQAANAIASNSSILELECNHFDLYVGKYFEIATDKMIEFLNGLNL